MCRLMGLGTSFQQRRSMCVLTIVARERVSLRPADPLGTTSREKIGSEARTVILF